MAALSNRLAGLPARFAATGRRAAAARGARGGTATGGTADLHPHVGFLGSGAVFPEDDSDNDDPSRGAAPPPDPETEASADSWEERVAYGGGFSDVAFISEGPAAIGLPTIPGTPATETSQARLVRTHAVGSLRTHTRPPPWGDAFDPHTSAARRSLADERR